MKAWPISAALLAALVTSSAAAPDRTDFFFRIDGAGRGHSVPAGGGSTPGEDGTGGTGGSPGDEDTSVPDDTGPDKTVLGPVRFLSVAESGFNPFVSTSASGAITFAGQATPLDVRWITNSNEDNLDETIGPDGKTATFTDSFSGCAITLTLARNSDRNWTYGVTGQRQSGESLCVGAGPMAMEAIDNEGNTDTWHPSAYPPVTRSSTIQLTQNEPEQWPDDSNVTQGIANVTGSHGVSELQVAPAYDGRNVGCTLGGRPATCTIAISDGGHVGLISIRNQKNEVGTVRYDLVKQGEYAVNQAGDYFDSEWLMTATRGGDFQVTSSNGIPLFASNAYDEDVLDDIALEFGIADPEGGPPRVIDPDGNEMTASESESASMSASRLTDRDDNTDKSDRLLDGYLVKSKLPQLYISHVVFAGYEEDESFYSKYGSNAANTTDYPAEGVAYEQFPLFPSILAQIPKENGGVAPDGTRMDPAFQFLDNASSLEHASQSVDGNGEQVLVYKLTPVSDQPDAEGFYSYDPSYTLTFHSSDAYLDSRQDMSHPGDVCWEESIYRFQFQMIQSTVYPTPNAADISQATKLPTAIVDQPLVNRRERVDCGY